MSHRTGAENNGKESNMSQGMMPMYSMVPPINPTNMNWFNPYQPYFNMGFPQFYPSSQMYMNQPGHMTMAAANGNVNDSATRTGNPFPMTSQPFGPTWAASSSTGGGSVFPGSSSSAPNPGSSSGYPPYAMMAQLPGAGMVPNVPASFGSYQDFRPKTSSSTSVATTITSTSSSTHASNPLEQTFYSSPSTFNQGMMVIATPNEDSRHITASASGGDASTAATSDNHPLVAASPTQEASTAELLCSRFGTADRDYAPSTLEVSTSTAIGNNTSVTASPTSSASDMSMGRRKMSATAAGLKRQIRHKIHYCTYDGCDYKTDRVCNLTNHIRVHTGEKPFVCSSCPYASSNLSNLRAHRKRHERKSVYLTEYKQREKEADEEI